MTTRIIAIAALVWGIVGTIIGFWSVKLHVRASQTVLELSTATREFCDAQVKHNDAQQNSIRALFKADRQLREEVYNAIKSNK